MAFLLIKVCSSCSEFINRDSKSQGEYEEMGLGDFCGACAAPILNEILEDD